MKKVLILRTSDTLCPISSGNIRPKSINMIVDNAEIHIRHADNRPLTRLDYDVIMVPKGYDITHLIPCLRDSNANGEFIYY